jgi:anti-sigma B factor antagonist
MGRRLVASDRGQRGRTGAAIEAGRGAMSGDRSFTDTELFPGAEAPAAMRLRREKLGPRRYRLILSGELDLRNAVDLRAEVSALLAERPLPTDVELDLAGVTFMDSLGLGTLVVGQRICGELGVHFAVRNPSPFVSRLLEVSGLRDWLSG